MDFFCLLFTQIAEMLPGILSQLGNEGLAHLKRLANNVVIGGSHKIMEEDEKDDIPDLVENFETVMNTGVEAPKVAAAPAVTPVATPAAQKPSATEKKVEETVTAPIAEAKKPETKPAAPAAPAPVDDKKDAKKETPKKADKKSNEKGAGNKQSGKNKKA